MSSQRALLASACIGLAVVGAACGGTSTRPYVGGPFVAPQAVLYQQVTERARSNGYMPLEEDASRGRFAVQAHTTLARAQSARFVVQCYRPGWFQVTVEGPSIRRSGDTMSLPNNLHAEYVDFSIALMEGLERPGAAGVRR